MYCFTLCLPNDVSYVMVPSFLGFYVTYISTRHVHIAAHHVKKLRSSRYFHDFRSDCLLCQLVLIPSTTFPMDSSVKN